MLDCSSMYNNVAFGNNMPSQYGAYAASRVPQQVSEKNEETLMGTLLGGGLFMAGIQGAPLIAHPINSYNAMTEANHMYKELLQSENFKKLTDIEKAKAYSNLFKPERLLNKVSKVDLNLRAEQETKAILDSFKKTQKNYIEALKSGNKEKAAKFAAELETIIAKGKKQGFFARHFTSGQVPKAYSAQEVTRLATEAGEKAQKTYATTEAAKAAAGSGVKATVKDALKTGGFKGMAAIEGTIEVFTNVLPAFQMGSDKGVKQLGKSAVTVGASAAGWCAGYAAGTAVGAKVGAAVGTAICPGVGTAVGTVIGLAGGLIGSWLGRKTAKAVVGKSEIEIAKEKQALAPQPQQTAPYITQTALPPTAAQTNYQFDFNNPINQIPQFNYNPVANFNTNPFATNSINLPALDTLLYRPIDSLS